MRGSRLIMLLLSTSAPGALSAAQRSAEATRNNPIRKVVTLMQNMQKEIEAEGVKEKELFDKFMCFCNGNSGDLAKGLADAKAKIEEYASRDKSSQAEKSQAEQDLVGHQSDLAAAEKDLKEATAVREKEAAEAAASIADSETNLKAVAAAIPALEKGLSGAALMQTSSGDRLSKIFDEFPFKDEDDRSNLMAFFQDGGEDTMSGSGSDEIVGIMKQMKDEMEATLKETQEEEAKAADTFASMKKSKEGEIETAKESIEAKKKRSSELAVIIVESQDGLEDQQKEAADTQTFMNNLEEQCANKQKEWDARQKARAQEIQAVSEAIEILNDDDALDTFKKAIPAPEFVQQGVSFLQRSSLSASPLRRAAAIVGQIAPHARSPQSGLMLLTLKSHLKRAVRSGAEGFEGVIKMVDELVVVEDKEQYNDDKEKPWCNGEFEQKDTEKTAEKTEIERLEADLAEKTDQIAELEDDIQEMADTIPELDKAVAEATEERKEGHEQYLEELHMAQVAVELVEKASQRMLKFYNPVLYKAPPKRERTMEEKIIDGGFFAQVHQAQRVTSRVAPPVAPESFSGGEPEKNGKSGGVIALMDQIIKDLKNDIQDSESEEKTAQKDYQALMEDSQKKRAGLTKDIAAREAEKANLGIKREDVEEADKGDQKDVLLIEQAVGELHGTCDFILTNYDARKEARETEMAQLKNAKAALAGAK